MDKEKMKSYYRSIYMETGIAGEEPVSSRKVLETKNCRSGENEIEIMGIKEKSKQVLFTGYLIGKK